MYYDTSTTKDADKSEKVEYKMNNWLQIDI